MADAHVTFAAADTEEAARERIVTSRQTALAARRERHALDTSSFAAEGYSPASYVGGLAAGDTEEAVAAAVRALTAAAEKSAGELRRAVFRQHGDFMAVAEQVARLEGGVASLRSTAARLQASCRVIFAAADVAPVEDEGFGSLTSSSGMASAHDSTPAGGSPRNGPMHTLGDIVEGVSAHEAMDTAVLRQDDSLVLQPGDDSADGRARPVTLVLCADALVVAVRPARRAFPTGTEDSPLHTRLSLEHRWPLSSVAAHAEAAILVVAVGSAPRRLVAASPAAAVEWARAISSARRRLGVSRDQADSASSHEDNEHEANDNRSAALGLSPSAAAELEEALDAMGTDAAMARYDSAVSACERVRSGLLASARSCAATDPATGAYTAVCARLQAETDALADALFAELRGPLLGRQAAATHARRLAALGRGEDARQRFLRARSDAAAERLRKLRCTGDAAASAADAAFAVCSSIATTAEWYLSAFGGGEHSEEHAAEARAALVQWTRVELAALAQSVAAQLQAADAGLAAVGIALAATRRHVSSLRVVGLDMLAFWDDATLPCVTAVLMDRRKTLEAAVCASVDSESWERVTGSAPASGVPSAIAAIAEALPPGLTACAAVFYDRLHVLLGDADALAGHEGDASAPPASPLLVDAVVRSAADLTEAFVTRCVCSAVGNADTGSRRTLAVLSNIAYIARVLLPALAAGLSARFGRGFADLGRLHARVDASADALLDAYAERAAAILVPSDALAAYASQPSFDDRPTISDWLATICRDAAGEHQAHVARAILARVLAALTGAAESLPPASADKSPGAEQLVLDTRFVVLACELFLRGDELVDAAKAAMEAAEGRLSTGVRRPPEFYDSRARQLLHSTYPFDFGL